MEILVKDKKILSTNVAEILMCLQFLTLLLNALCLFGHLVKGL